MLTSMRRGADSWPVRILLILIVASFLFWGVQTSVITGGDAVAEVGDVRVSQQEFFNAHQRMLARLSSERDQPMTRQEAWDEGVTGEVLRQEIQQAAFAQGAEALGVRPSDDRVRQAILDDPSFQGPTGAFDQQSYAAVLRDMGYTRQGYEKNLRRRLAIYQDLLPTLVNGARVPNSLVKALYDFQFEGRNARYFEIRSATVSGIAEPTEDELRDLYESNPAPYTKPEYRSISYISLQPKNVVRTIEVTEELIQAAYEERISEYQAAEKRDLQVITADTEDAANSIKTKIDGGTDFLAAGMEAGRSAEEINLGEVGRDDIAYMGDDAVGAAFALDEGDISAPVQTDLGWMIFRANAVIASKVTPLEEARPELEKTVKDQEAKAKVEALGTVALEEVTAGAPLEGIAELIGLPVQSVEAVDRSGLDPNGDIVVGLPASRSFYDLAFSKQLGEPVDLEEGDEGYYIIRLDSITESAVKPFEDVKDQVRAAWMRNARNEKAAELAKEAVSRLDKGEDFATVAESYGALPTETTAPFYRTLQGMPGNFSPDAVLALFNADEGDAASAINAFGNGYVVGVVTEVRQATVDPDSDTYKNLTSNIERSLENDIAVQYEQYIYKNYAVERNDALVRQVLQLDVGQ